jgi:hypothetical protein
LPQIIVVFLYLRLSLLFKSYNNCFGLPLHPFYVKPRPIILFHFMELLLPNQYLYILEPPLSLVFLV